MFSCTINAIPYKRYRRQIISADKDLPYGGWAGGTNNPSGGGPGAYYGSGINPNYGMIGPNPNDAQNSINLLNYNNPYNTNWNQQQQLLQPQIQPPQQQLLQQQLQPQIQQPQQQQQQQPYLYNQNYNNAWQTPSMNNYYNQPNNRYPPGSQGWFATGGNNWYNNKGQSLIPYAWLLIISILISIIYI